MLVNLLIVSFDKRFNLFLDIFLVGADIYQTCRRLAVLIHLVLVKVAFQKPMVQVNRGKLFKLLWAAVTEFLDHKLNEVFEHVNIVDKYLQHIIDAHLLVLAKLQLLIFLYFKLAMVDGVIHESSHDIFNHVHDQVSLTLR